MLNDNNNKNDESNIDDQSLPASRQLKTNESTGSIEPLESALTVALADDKAEQKEEIIQ